MRYSHRASSRCWTVSSLAPEGRGNRGNRSVPSSLGRGSALPGGGFGGRPLLGLLGRGSLFPGGALLPLLASGGFSRALLVRHRWRSHPRFRNRRRTGGRRRCRPRPCWRRLMNRLRSRTVLPRCCCRCLRRVRDWLRPVSRRWQMGEVWRTRRMFRRCRRWRWRRRTRCRHLRLRRPIFSRCRRSGRRRYHRGDMPGLLHRLLCRIRPDPRGARCEKSGAPGAWPGVGAGGAALAVGGDAGAAAAEGWRAPPGVACTLAGVVGDFCEASGMGLTRGAGASCEKFGRTGGRATAGSAGLA